MRQFDTAYDLEETMKKVKKAPTNEDESAPMENTKPNHTEKIKSQVLAKIGKPPRLDRVEVNRHHNGKYRVNIWQQQESDKSIAVSVAPRIGLSYYLTVSETGEIVDSNPPLTKLSGSA
jgi:hypothetical protein